ncbi:probable ubiquitin-like-specific protease 2A isoform X3 [Momordica charantia]|uniref:Probable ubiquitin-like-specific protease 2A isoform X3 n=1 Tax=Momordica charantia TaxID=3673 RepID=A0A6J1CK91_MOMCH|nr:probable ubiquitin-like-specific protease 2A isoform X3 [Momordica charantia]
MNRSSKRSSSRSRKGGGAGGDKRFDVFDFSQDDHRVEEVSQSLLGKFSTGSSSAVTKYQFLQCFAKGAASLRENVSVEFIDIDAEVEKGADTDSLCEDVSYEITHINSKVAKGAESLGNVSIELIDIDAEGADTDSSCESASYEITRINSKVANSASHQISTGPSDLASEDTCVDRSPEDGLKEREIFETSVVLLSRAANNEDDVIVIFPDFVIYEGQCCTTAKLIFSRSCIKLQGSVVNGGWQRTFDCQWAISDIVGIESEWCRRVETAIVNLLLKGKNATRAGNANEISGIEPVKFSICDPLWSEREKAIRSLNLKYNDLWNANYDDKIDWEEIVSRRQSDVFSPKHCFFEFIEPFEEVIYPKGDADAVTINKRDLELLKPGAFINDTIIDFYINFFFRKLVDLDKDLSSACGGRAAFQRVHKWTKKVNLFEKDYIFIPINYSLDDSLHWSLVVICHPGEVGNLKDKKCDNLSKVPCILHLDSIKGSHRGLMNLFQNYLCEEWKERHGDGDVGISAKFLALQFVPLELPQQENSFDCGLFLLHYVERFLEGAPVNFSPFKISRFSNFLNQDWFPPIEASLKRAHILQLIYDIMVNDHGKEFSGSIGKYPSSIVGHSDSDLSRHVYLEEVHTSTTTCSDKFTSGEKEKENEMSTLLACPPKRFRELGLVSKVSSDTNYQQIGGQSRSVMSPIEEDENGEISDSPQCLEDRNHASAIVSECSSASSFGQQFRELEISTEGRFSRNAKDKDRRPSSQPSLGESHTISVSGRDYSPQANKRLDHPTEADEPETLTTSSEELATCVVEDSEEEYIVEDSEEADEMYNGIEVVQSGNSMHDSKEIEISSSLKNDSFLSREAGESSADFNDNRQHDLIVSNVHTAYGSSKQHSAKRPRVDGSGEINLTP